MKSSHEWTLTLPYSGGWIQVSAKIPDMAAISEPDAKFIDAIREQMLDEIHRLILARKEAAVAGQPEKNAGEDAGLDAHHLRSSPTSPPSTGTSTKRQED